MKGGNNEISSNLIIYLKNIPDKIVSTDIINYIYDNDYRHIFYKYHRSLRPNELIEHELNFPCMHLYSGGLGLGHYLEICYDCLKQGYVLFIFSDSENKNISFESVNWREMYDYVNNYFLIITSNNSVKKESNRIEEMKMIQKEGLELFIKKNRDYDDAFAKYGIIGLLMRIEDKIQRALSITKNGVNLVKDEGIKDTLLDLHNYAAMALMLYE